MYCPCYVCSILILLSLSQGFSKNNVLSQSSFCRWIFLEILLEAIAVHSSKYFPPIPSISELNAANVAVSAPSLGV